MQALVLGFLFIFVPTLTQALENSAPPQSLLEAIAKSFILNSKINSKDISLAAMHEQTIGVKHEAYPSGSVSCGRTISNQTMQTPQITDHYRSYDGNCSFNASVTLFDGGAHEAAVQAAKAAEEAQRELYSSTNPLVLNTKGVLAMRIMQAFTTLVMNRKINEMYEKDIEFLKKFEKVAEGLGLADQLKVKISGMVNNMSLNRTSIDKAILDFEYSVTLPPADDIEDFTSAISSLMIPESAEKAMAIAREKSPDIKTTDSRLIQEQKILERMKAQLGPTITLNYSYSRDRYSGLYDSPISDQRTRGGTWSILLTIPLSEAAYHYTRAQGLNVEAAKKERDSALDDIYHTLKSSYLTLDRQTQTMEKYMSAIVEIKNSEESLIAEVESGVYDKQTINRAISLVDSDTGAHYSLLGIQTEILFAKFSIQQSVGTLFEFVLNRFY